MRFLIDVALSLSVAKELTAAGHDAVDARDYRMHRAADPVILHRAAQEQRVLVSADTDFGTLLALSAATRPSVILFRGGLEYLPALQIELLLVNLVPLQMDLEQGCIVIIEPGRIRVRPLPIQGS
ncbi:MAG: DUF5615 family PIN-like protein [Chloroflexi bacterium]|nr:DUF5615 family PIN-like protein [Chloroflexota bacterium]